MALLRLKAPFVGFADSAGRAYSGPRSIETFLSVFHYWEIQMHHEFKPLDLADVLELVQLVRGGVKDNAPDILIVSGCIVGGLGTSWKERRKTDVENPVAFGLEVGCDNCKPEDDCQLPETVVECCEAIDTLLAPGDNPSFTGMPSSKGKPWLELLVSRLIEKLLAELLS